MRLRSSSCRLAADKAIGRSKSAEERGLLSVKFMNSYIGSGVFVNQNLKKGEFVCFYEGDLISGKEGLLRFCSLPKQQGSFLFFFRHNGQEICGNSITKECSPDEICKDIVNLVQELKLCGVARVFVCSILPRGKFLTSSGMDKATFDKIRKSVNERLKKHLKTQYIDAGKRVLYPKHYDSDMVHPGVKKGGVLRLRNVIISAFTRTLSN